jgi:hypothetical protein
MMRVGFRSSVVTAIVAVACSAGMAFAGSAGGGIGSDALHFKCYLVEGGANPNHVVDLVDQFSGVDGEGNAIPQRIGVGSARLLCSPVAKTVVSGDPPPTVLDPDAVADHYTCYDMRRPDRPLIPSVQDPRALVTLTNQFGEDTVRVRASAFLCAPTIKCHPATSPCPPAPIE